MRRVLAAILGVVVSVASASLLPLPSVSRAAGGLPDQAWREELSPPVFSLADLAVTDADPPSSLSPSPAQALGLNDLAITAPPAAPPAGPLNTISPDEVSVTGPTTIDNCQTVTFTIVATNDAITATNVTITSTMPGDFSPSQQTFDVGEIAPGETITRYATFTAGCNAVSGQNVVTITQDGGPTIGPVYTDFSVNPGAITLRKEPAVIQAGVGDVVTWTVYVNNTGYGTVSNVAVTDTLGSGLSFAGGQLTAAYPSIAAGEVETFTVSAEVVACSGLNNDVEATWGCEDQTCQTQTAQASVDLQIREPLLDYTPPSISIDYCTGQATYQMPITNTGEGIAYTPTLEVNFSPLIVTDSSAPYVGGEFSLPDIAANGGSYVLTFTLALPDSPCGMEQGGSLTYWPYYYDECGNLFYPPVETGNWDVSGDTPSLSVSKSGPVGDEIYATEILTYNLGITATDFPSAATIYITDTFQPGCVGYTPLSTGGGTVISDASGSITITWNTTDTNWTAQISFQPDITACPTMCACCGLIAANTLRASATDCQTCTVTASDSVETAIQCEEILNSHDKEISPTSAEACTTRTYTSTYVFGSSFTVTPTWQGMIYTDTLLNQTYVTGSAGVLLYNGSLTCTATFSESAIGGRPLVLSNISPNCGIPVPGATMIITFQSVVDDFTSCSDATFYDWSYFNIGVTGNGICPGDPQCDDGLFEEGVWVGVTEPDMSLSISGVPEIVSACGIYTPLVTLSRGATPAYDARLRFPTDDYAVIEVLGFGGATPVITRTGVTSWTWEYGDAFATATTGTVRLRVQRRCAATGPVQATLYYGNLCADDATYDDTCSDTGSETPFVLDCNPLLYKYPEIIYATGDVVTWTLSAINSGAGIAYGVVITDALGSGLRYFTSTITSTMGSYAGATLITSTNLITYTDLTVLPGEEYTILMAAEIVGCDNLTNTLHGQQGCQGAICHSCTPRQSHVELPPTLLLSTNQSVTPIDSCLTRTVTVTVRNAGLTSVYSATITETLPAGMSYIAGTTVYSFNGGPWNADVDPSISGQDHIWAHNDGSA
ncbi:MAG: hypothetical protein SVX38_05450, partial [Chloroflexota bacterium]|nr:hypothetical protein [Chloroflexota bacterium]